MDLGAYANIEALDELVKKNGIVCPRLRGYRLMKDEEKVDIKEVTKDIEKQCLHTLCTSIPIWSTKPDWCEYSSYTDYVCKYYGADYYEIYEPLYLCKHNYDQIKNELLSFVVKNVSYDNISGTSSYYSDTEYMIGI